MVAWYANISERPGPERAALPEEEEEEGAEEEGEGLVPAAAAARPPPREAAFFADDGLEDAELEARVGGTIQSIGAASSEP